MTTDICRLHSIQNTKPQPTGPTNVSNTVYMSSDGYKDLVGCKDGKDLYWTTDVNMELPIKMGHSGPSASIAPDIVPNAFLTRARHSKKKPAMRVMRNKREYVWTWEQFHTEVMAFAKSLEAMGIQERKCVNIMGFNSPEWAIAFFGAIFHNNPVSGVYITNGAKACQYQAEHSEAQVIVVDTLKQLQLYHSVLDSLPEVKAIVTWGVDNIPEEIAKDSRIMTWKSFMDLGKKVEDQTIMDIVAKERPGHCILLIYTSGTTGNPKGVMLSHDNILFDSINITDDLGIVTEAQAMGSNNKIVSYLPLSHIAGLEFDLFTMITIGTQVYFAKPDALQGSLVETLQWARPSAFLAVPRVWEKFEDKLKEIAKSKPGFMQSISNWAKSQGAHRVAQLQKGNEDPLMYKVADFLILKRIKQAIGLDQCNIFMFGAAPLKQSTVNYFASLDIPILNMYGLSETTGSTTAQCKQNMNLQSAGKMMSGAELKIADPDEKGVGEIRMKGRQIMMGYFKNEQATRDCMDEDGYFKTGDLGVVCQKGYLRITGRIKELIITAGGENVAPVPIEDTFKAILPACGNIMLVGENRRFISGLITFKVDIDMSTGMPSDNLTKDTADYLSKVAGETIKTSTEAGKNEKVHKHIQECIEATNKKTVSKAAHIKKFTCLPMDFSQPGGELTPTMKLKRKVTEQKYAKEIEAIYAVEAKM